MSWKDMKLGAKIMTGIGSVIILLAVVSITSFSRVNQMNGGIHNMEAHNAIGAELYQREIDHLKWAAAVSRFINDNEVTELKIQTDHTKCGFGNWYYGEGRQFAESLMPILREPLAAIEEPHKKLHESAIRIKNTLQPADVGLPAFLAKREADHLAWSEAILKAILTRQNTINVQLDHTKCAFGTFVYGEMGEKMSTSDPLLANLLNSVKAPHQQLHESGYKIQDALAINDFETAHQIYINETQPLLKIVRDYLGKMQKRAEENIQSVKMAQTIYFEETQSFLQEVQQLLRQMVQMSKNIVLEEEQELFNMTTSTQNIIIAVSVIAIVIGLLLAVVITRSITIPIHQGVQFAQRVSKGDLSEKINLNQRDETGILINALNDMIDSLRTKVELSETIAKGDLSIRVNISSQEDALGMAQQTMVSNLNDILYQVTSAAEQMLAGSQQVSQSSQIISQGATEQAAALEEISASVEQLSAQAETTADNAGQANQLSAAAHHKANDGNEQMQRMLASIEMISESSKNISNIMKTIDEIAFQTNVLAINAAVEAARAGVHGKGFAVVAEEVRSLAQNSAEAAKETTKMITDSIKKVEDGAKIANQTAVSLREIVESAIKVTDLVNEIAVASNEQAKGVSQINQGLGQLNQVTQQNTQVAQETASTSTQLSGQSNGLKHVVSQFKLKQQSYGMSSSILSDDQSYGMSNGLAVVVQEAALPQQSMQHTSSQSSPGEGTSFDEENTGKL